MFLSLYPNRVIKKDGKNIVFLTILLVNHRVKVTSINLKIVNLEISKCEIIFRHV